MIFIASPYTSFHDDKVLAMAQQNDRAAQSAAYCAHLLRQGFSAFSPIAHGHAVGLAADLPTDEPYWRQVNGRILTFAATAVHVLMLDGWEHSRGIAWELASAENLQLTITYVNSTWSSEAADRQ